jgi:hypothetical protein
MIFGANFAELKRISAKAFHSVTLSTSLSSNHLRNDPQSLFQRFDEVVVSPHHGLIHA